MLSVQDSTLCTDILHWLTRPVHYTQPRIKLHEQAGSQNAAASISD